MQLSGQWDYTLDRGKITIPPRFQDKFMDGAILTLGPNGYLRIYPQKNEDEFPPSQYWQAKMDDKGRIQIPRKLINLFSLGGKVALFGEGEYFEIRPEDLRGKIVVPRDGITIEAAQRLGSQGTAVVGDGNRYRVILERPRPNK